MIVWGRGAPVFARASHALLPPPALVGGLPTFHSSAPLPFPTTAALLSNEHPRSPLQRPPCAGSYITPSAPSLSGNTTPLSAPPTILPPSPHTEAQYPQYRSAPASPSVTRRHPSSPSLCAPPALYRRFCPQASPWPPASRPRNRPSRSAPKVSPIHHPAPPPTDPLTPVHCKS